MAAKERFVASGVRRLLGYHMFFGYRAEILHGLVPALLLLSVLAGVGLAGCGKTPADIPSQPPRVYHLEGTVVSIDKTKPQLVVNHKAIPGLMAAMTMGYPVAVEEVKMLDQIAPGDQITADIVVDDAGARLRNIVIVKKGDGSKAAPTALQETSPTGAPTSASAEKVPDFSLINQDGARISVAQYRGKALLITFIYTRCPLPDQCPLMTHNFAVIEKALAGNPALYAGTRLLSVSFDSQYDTPAILLSYARGFGVDRFDHWEFATLPAAETRDVAKFFNIFINEQQGQINHSTGTAILAPDGSVYRWYPGNDWKPDTVLADLGRLLSQNVSRIAQERTLAAAR